MKTAREKAKGKEDADLVERRRREDFETLDDFGKTVITILAWLDLGINRAVCRVMCDMLQKHYNVDPRALLKKMHAV